jgi:hypothetical protein
MSTVLQDMLNHVVPVLVVQQLPVTFFDFIQRSSFLRLDTMLENALKYSASVWVARKTGSIGEDIVNDKVNLFIEILSLCFVTGFEGSLGLFARDFNTFLNYMVSILVLDTA